MEVHSGWEQYTSETVGEWHFDIDLQPITDLDIGRDSDGWGFKCTSSEVLNSVFDYLGRAIDE